MDNDFDKAELIEEIEQRRKVFVILESESYGEPAEKKYCQSQKQIHSAKLSMFASLLLKCDKGLKKSKKVK